MKFFIKTVAGKTGIIIEAGRLGVMVGWLGFTVDVVGGYHLEVWK